MKTIVPILIGALLCQPTMAQEIIMLPNENTTDIVWHGTETSNFSEQWQTLLVSNVSEPSLEIFRPDSTLNNGTSVIIAPGGGLRVLSINNEGKDVAKWLNTKGITAFVLKYRLIPPDMNDKLERMDSLNRA